MLFFALSALAVIALMFCVVSVRSMYDVTPNTWGTPGVAFAECMTRGAFDETCICGLLSFRYLPLLFLLLAGCVHFHAAQPAKSLDRNAGRLRKDER